MYIARVAIENFRNFANLVIDPWPTPAVIIGENNTGKSNVLHALRLVLDDELPDRQRQLRASDVWDGHRAGIEGGVSVRITVDLSGFEDDSAVNAALTDCLLAEDNTVARISYLWEPYRPSPVPLHPESKGSAVPSLPVAYTTADYQWSLVAGADDHPIDIFTLRRFIGFKFISAMRDAESELFGRSGWELRTLAENSLPSGQTAGTREGSHLTEAMDKLGKDPAIDELQSSFRDRRARSEGKPLPVDPSFDFVSADPDQLLAALHTFTDEARMRSVPNSSLGTANAFYIAMSLATQREMKQHTATVLAVEEPEAHLHPQAQRRMIKSLLRDEPSVVLTTHSPHVVAVAPLHSLVLLRQTDRNTSGARTTMASDLTAEQRADLQRHLGATQADMLFARFVIFVEGDVEAYVVSALADAAGFDLDGYGVRIVSIRGNDFAHYRKLLSQAVLDIPHVAVIDGDVRREGGTRREPGLIRAARLVDDMRTRESLIAQIVADGPTADMTSGPAEDADTNLSAQERESVLRALAGHGLHVAQWVLEPDLARYFPDQLIAAFQELVPEERHRTRFARLIQELTDKSPAEHAAWEIAATIDGIGRRRFAQRLAEYLKDLDRATLIAASETGEALGLYIFRALDAASRRVRRTSLEGKTDTGDGERA